jgi:ketosteroid isomerase-like protein
MAANVNASETVEFIRAFQECFNTGDVDGLMSAMTEDTVFEHMAPPSVSVGRHEGQAAVRAVWESMPEHFPNGHFRIDDIFAAGDRCTCRYTLTFDNPDGGRETRVGVDVFRMRDGKIAEKLTHLTL